MKVIGYSPERKQDIIDLNVWWIEKYFGKVEKPDWDEFEHVDEEIEKGGMAFFAVDDEGRALATCMAIKRGEDEWEIAKLGSDPKRPHKGCGTAVFEACVEWAERHCARRIYILTNSSLSAAIHIYESHGFERIRLDDYGGYERGDIATSIYTEELFGTYNDEDNRAEVARHATDELNLVGVALRGKKNPVDRLTKHLPMHE